MIERLERMEAVMRLADVLQKCRNGMIFRQESSRNTKEGVVYPFGDKNLTGAVFRLQKQEYSYNGRALFCVYRDFAGSAAGGIFLYPTARFCKGGGAYAAHSHSPRP